MMLRCFFVLLCFQFCALQVQSQCFIPDVNLDYCPEEIVIDLTTTQTNGGGTYEYFNGLVPIINPNAFPVQGFVVLDGKFTQFGTGCIAEFKLFIDVVLMPDIQLDDVYTVFCGQSISIEPIINSALLFNFSWFEGFSLISIERTLNTAVAGEYRLEIEDIASGCTRTKEFTVESIETEPFDLGIQQNCDSTASLIIDFVNPVDITQYSFQWIGSGIIDQSDPLAVVVDTFGIYICEITDPNNCVTPIQFQVDSIDCIDVGIPLLSLQKNLSLFPNPFSNTIHLESQEFAAGIIVVDHLGRIVAEINEPGNRYNLSQLPVGSYFIGVKMKKEIHWRRAIKY